MSEKNNSQLLQQIVFAISQAITVDAPRHRAEHRLDTNNHMRYIVGDYINENLRHQVESDTVEVIDFKRSGWDGRLIAGHDTSTTYTIISQKTLRQAIRKERKVPYYLRAILVQQNRGLEGTPKQMTMADFCPEITMDRFTDEEYGDTYYSMFGEHAEEIKNYQHYVIVYDMESAELKSIALCLFDRDFAVVEETDLAAYRKPDFAALTGYQNEPQAVERKAKTDSKNKDLVKLKPRKKEQKEA